MRTMVPASAMLASAMLASAMVASAIGAAARLRLAPGMWWGYW